jgi:hypothetical protein
VLEAIVVGAKPLQYYWRRKPSPVVWLTTSNDVYIREIHEPKKIDNRPTNV